MNKACSACKITKPITEFHVREDSTDGHRGACSTCDGDRKKKYNETHFERHVFCRRRAERLRRAADPEKYRAKGRITDKKRQPQKTDYMRERRRTNENFRIASALRARLS